MEITVTKCLHCGQVISGEEVKSHPCFTLQTEASCVKCRAWISGYLMCECEAMQGCWQDEQGMQALEEAMWARYQAEEAIEPVPEQVAEKDCPLCPEWAEEKFKIGYDDFGGICQIDGVACCDTCYRVYHLTHPYEESNE